MKTMLKRIVSLSLCIFMCLTVLSVFAQEIAPGYRIQKKLSEADNAYCARSGNEGQLQQEGGFSIWRADSWVEYKNINIPAAGNYRIGIKVGSVSGAVTMAKVSIDGEVAIDMESAVPVGEYHSQIEVVYGILTFEEAGTHTVHILGTGGGAHYADYMYIEYLGEPITVSSITAGESDILAGDPVSSGCDVLTVEFSRNISAELADSLEGKVILEDENGKEIKAIGKVSGKKLDIALLKALSPGKTYTISLVEVYDSLNYSSVTNEEYSFVTEIGDGVATIVDGVATVYGDQIELSAKLLSSANVGIEGRAYNVFLILTDGEAVQVPVMKGQSGPDGVIEGTLQMSEGSPDGEYALVLDSEYSEKVTVKFVYVQKPTKEAIEQALNNCADETEVEAVLSDVTNAFYLGIDPAKEIGSTKKAEVYKHFVGKDIAYDDIAKTFRKYIAVENFRQAKNAIKFRSVVAKEENWNNLGVNKAKYNVFSNETAVTITVVNQKLIALSSITDAEEYIENFEEVLDTSLLLTIGKEKAELKGENISAYVNQGVSVPVSFKNEISDVSKVIFSLTVSDEALFENTEFVSENTAEVVVDGKTLTGVLEFDSPVSVEELGSVSLQMPKDTGSFDVKIEAEITYAPAEFDFTLGETAASYELDIDVTENPKDNPIVESQRPSGNRRPSGSSSGGSSGGSVTVKPTEPPKEEVKEFSFSDVSKEHWAHEAVDYLLKKGIVEETEDGKFNPDLKAPREEIVKMMVLALGLTDDKAESKLKDVEKTNPYYKYIASAEKYGIILGNDLGEFMIGKSVTREDICVIIHRAVKKIYSFSTSTEKFSDNDKISDYAKEAVSDLFGAKIINGMGDGTFAPKGDMTRAQAAKMIYEIIKAVER